MSSHKTGEGVNATAHLQTALPRATAKRLARLADVPVETARHWVYRNFSTARQREIARLLLAEMQRQDREERAAAQQWLAEIAGGDEVASTGDPMAGELAGAGAAVAAEPPDALPSRRLRLARRLAGFVERD